MNHPSNSPSIQMPSLALPKGGGAIKSIGETFKPDAFTGAANYSINIPVTAARGFEPRMSVNYSSGNGNSIFGMGFSIPLSAISVRTRLGVPRYDGTDIFMLDGNELVLKNKTPGKNGVDWDVFEYWPRVQGAFSLISHFVKADKSGSYWQVTTNDNTVTVFGGTDASRIFNPDNPSQIFQWLIEQSTDAKGNKIVYTYKAENSDNIPDMPWEKNRSYNNRYIQKIQYGNYTDKQGSEQFAYELIFDYGEYLLPSPGSNNPSADPYIPVNKWAYRPDAFSAYDSGFEIRHCRLCSNIMLFHLFEAELGDPCLANSIHFDYRQANSYGDTGRPGLSLLSNATLTGYRRQGRLATGNYDIQQMPPLSFTFSAFQPPREPAFKQLTIDGGNIPGYLDSSGFQPVDLDGEGISGLLYHNDASIYYCSPEGEGRFDGPAYPLHFPADRDAALSFSDLNGDGVLDLVVSDGQRNGYYLKKLNGNWQHFSPFTSFPTNMDDPAIETAGLNNNGKTDALIVDQAQLTVYPSLGTEGYAPAVTTKKQTDFPLVKQDYREEYVGFADLAGDGLPHRVKISNGRVEYWPDMGHGIFGKKITAGNSPWFGSEFDSTRLFLADIDGSGTTDLVYVYHDKINFYINLSGNYFSDPITIDLPEPWSANDRVSFADIKGNGTNCLVFSKAGAMMRHYYYDFTGETILDGQPEKIMKPYLLIEIDNNMGAATQVHYSSAVKFYLEDKKSGDPWCTRLPFPVQVVEKIRIIDKISKSCYTTRFRFHDGHYDRVEREFIGFGFVETWDAETYENTDNENYVPPVYTRAWYHTGACFDNPAVMASYKAHFFKGDPRAYDFPDVVFDEAIYAQDPDTLRQAWLSLKGAVIRTEVYADDGELNPLLYQNPYTVTQSNQKVFLYQQKGAGPFAVFLVVPRESISYHYERNPEDPRVEQGFTLVTDTFGNTIESCTMYLSRRPNSAVDFVKYPEQLTVKGILNYNRYADAVDGFLFCHIPCEEQQFELSGIEPGAGAYFSFDGIKKQVEAIGLPDRSKIIPYGEAFTSGVQARQIAWSRHYFWNWAYPDAQPVLGVISSPGLLHHMEEAVFPKQFTIDVYDGRLIDEAAYQGNGYLSNIICTHGGYFYNPENGYWWNKGLVQYYLMASFYLPCKTENSFAKETPGQDPSLIAGSSLAYDDYYFFVIQLTREIDNKIANTIYAQTDYITGQPYQSTDINGNTAQVLFDPLGQVMVTSVFGLENGDIAGGMTLYADGSKKAEYQDPGKGSFSAVIGNSEKFLQGAATYFFYNLHAWMERQQPVCSIHLTRYEHWHTQENTGQPFCQVSISYTDGLGRGIEQKLRTGIYEDREDHIADAKWQVTGRTVYNNKGKPCEQYLPYFSAIPEYEDQLNATGPPPTVTHYDPLLRVVRVDTPKRFFSKTEFTPWSLCQYDEDDTLADSWFYKNEYPGHLTPNEIDAIKKAVKFYNTPAVTIYDNTGYSFLTMANNLGNVAKDAFVSLQTTVISSEAIWNNLLSNGYLAPWSGHAELDLHFLTPKFQPYTRGFVLHLDPPYQNILQQITGILKANCLTTYYETDISGRVVTAVDPRLYYNNIFNSTSCYNFKYRYAMSNNAPVLTDSVDAGAEKHLFNIFGAQLWTWSPRSYCQFILYDRLQRKTALTVKKITTPGPVTNYDDFNLVETFTYGENCTNATSFNLRGQVYQVKDLSGIVINSSFTMQGQPLKSTRQMLADFRSAADWSGPLPLLEDKVYQVAFTYNAIQQMKTQATPDGAITTNTYNQAGRLDTVFVKFPGTAQSIIDTILYDAKGQRTMVKYGNGILTRYTYEETTLRLAGIKSTRPASGNNNTVVQDLAYYYDPAGNITRTLDNTAAIVFCNNQRIDPLNDYTYNAIYKLTIATGRQHTGIAANTYQDNSPDSFKQCFFGPPPAVADSGKLENYTEKYSYDDSGNLVHIKHTASSTTSWSRDLPVADNSNRLANAVYDASGNLRKLDISNEADLSWNCCENLVKAGIIKRLDQPDDCDYYLYDSNEMRTRKVLEQMSQGGSLTQVEDRIYLGNYEIKRNISLGAGGTAVVKSERQTIRVMDEQSCVAIIHCTTSDISHPEMEGLLQVRFQLNNYIGSVCLEIDTAAQLISYEEYFPYGGTSIITGIDQAEVKAKEYRYSGKERDDSTGLYYYGLRYYVPWQGRWLKPDPAGTVDGLNLYAFVGGNPVINHDANGTSRQRANKRRKLSSGGSSSDGGGKSEEEDEEDNNDNIDPDRDKLLDVLGTKRITIPGTNLQKNPSVELEGVSCWNWALNGGELLPKDRPLHAHNLYDMSSGLFKSKQIKGQFGFGGFGDIPETLAGNEKVAEILKGLNELHDSNEFKKIKSGTPNARLNEDQQSLQRRFMEGTMKIAAIAAGLEPLDTAENATFTIHMDTIMGQYHTFEHWGIGVLRRDNKISIIQKVPGKAKPRDGDIDGALKINSTKLWYDKSKAYVNAVIGVKGLLPAHYKVLLGGK